MGTRADAVRARPLPADPPVGVSAIDHSRFIASLIGPILLALGVSLLLNPGLVAAISDDLAHSRSLLVVTGMAGMLLGLLIVRTHSVWRGWPIAVTLVGWIALIGGTIRVLFPDAVAHWVTAVGAAHQGLAPFAGGVLLLAGLFFTWQGWFIPAAPVPTAFED